MVEKHDPKNLPSDVASKIASFMVGKPEDVRLKHNEALKKEITSNTIALKKTDGGTESYFDENQDYGDGDEGDCCGTVIQYDLMQIKVEKHSVLSHYIDEQYDKVKNIINKEMKIQKKIGNVRKINIQFYREYKNDNLNQYRHDDKKNFKLLRRDSNIEVELQIDYDDNMEVSAHNLWAEFDTKPLEVVRK